MTLVPEQLHEMPRSHEFTCEEFYQMADAGMFQDQRVELIEGDIIDMAPQKDVHAAAVLLVTAALQKAFPERLVRPQLPLHLGQKSEPEPDASVVEGRIRDYVGTGHPKTALLVVEVADATLPFDRSRKAAMYAKAGIRDYWIVNLIENCVEVMRDPTEDKKAVLRWKYSHVTTLRKGEVISPLAKPEAPIPVADLLP